MRRLTKPCMITWPAIVPTDDEEKPEASRAMAKSVEAPLREPAFECRVRLLDAVDPDRPKKTAAAIASMEMLTTPAIVIAMITSIRSKRWIRRSSARCCPGCGPASAPSAGRRRAASRSRRGCPRRGAATRPRRSRGQPDGARPSRGRAVRAQRWRAKATTMTPTSAAMTASSRRKPERWRARITNAPEPARSAAGKSGMPKRRWSPSAAPSTSARSVAMAISSAWIHRPSDTGARMIAAHLGEVAAGRDPELRRERLDDHRHQVRRKDDPQKQVAELGPGRTFVAKLPGSTYATAAMNAGPRKGQSPRSPCRWPASASWAARSVAASPGSTSPIPGGGRPGAVPTGAPCESIPVETIV